MSMLGEDPRKNLPMSAVWKDAKPVELTLGELAMFLALIDYFGERLGTPEETHADAEIMANIVGFIDRTGKGDLITKLAV